MKCKKCAEQVAPTARFCTCCGERQDVGGALQVQSCPLCRKSIAGLDLVDGHKCPKCRRKLEQQCNQCSTARLVVNNALTTYCHICGCGEFKAIGRVRPVLKACPICTNPCKTDRCSDPGCSNSLVINANVNGYTIQGFLGRGGMGMVYKALSPNGEIVALKEIRPIIQPAAIDPDNLYRNELQAMAVFKRIPEVVKLRGTFETTDGRYVIMELLPGQTLESLVLANGKMPKKFVWELVQRLCTIVIKMNTVAVLRDLKTSNVMITNPRDPHSLRIFDLGYVYLQNPSAFRFSNNMILGSPGFSPREQLGKDVLIDLEKRARDSRPRFTIPGNKPSSVEWPPSPAWDAHAIGAIAYHLLTGTDPSYVLYAWNLDQISSKYQGDPFRTLLETSLAEDNRFSDVRAMLVKMQQLGGY